jgi:predicted ribosome quality control (RQC) complex YloA/Tae2 family protein
MMATANNPNQGRFEHFLGNKYAQELQELQARFGPAHQTSHALRDADFTLGHLVTAGINNLATVIMQAKQSNFFNKVQPVAVQANNGGLAEGSSSHPNMGYANYRYYQQ